MYRKSGLLDNFVDAHTHTYIYIYVRVYVCVYVYSIHIHIHVSLSLSLSLPFALSFFLSLEACSVGFWVCLLRNKIKGS